MSHRYETLVLHFTGEVPLENDTLRQWKLRAYDPIGAYPVFIRWRGPTADDMGELRTSAEAWRQAFDHAGRLADDERAELRRLLTRARRERESGRARLAVVADGMGTRSLIAMLREDAGRSRIDSVLLRLPIC